MRLTITSVATMGKSISAKRKKQDDDTQATIAHLKFAGLFLQREEIDALCCQPAGWCRQFYDDQGAPVLRAVLSLPNREFTVIGRVKHQADAPASLAFTDATLAGMAIAFTDLGGELSGELTWRAAGDEISDAEPLLGQLTRVEWTVRDDEQGDLLRAVA